MNCLMLEINDMYICSFSTSYFQQQFRFEGPIFPTVKELVDHYMKEKLPVTNRSGAVIKKPVKRENWELNNDDVQLIEKIGRVCATHFSQLIN